MCDPSRLNFSIFAGMLSFGVKNTLLLRQLILLQLVLPAILFAQNTTGGKAVIGEKGVLGVYNYSPKSYKAAPQNWAIQQDKRGVLYIGNNEGILEYDGVSWRLIEVSNETNVRSLAMDAQGRIFVGAYGEMGFLEPDSSGNMRYHSLTSFVSKKDQNFGDVWSTVAARSGIYFQTENRMFRWDGTAMKVWNAEKSFHRIFNVNGHIFARQREIGLMELVNENLVPVKGGEAFAEESIYSMVAVEEGSSENILICTKKKGIYTLKHLENSGQPACILKTFKTQVDPFLTENISYNVVKAGTLYSIATVTNGVAVVNTDGILSGMLNKQTGMEEETVYSQFSDASGNLWLATSNGLSKVSVNSPVTAFSDKNGLNGTVFDIVRHDGILYVVTNHGVSFLNPATLSAGTTFTPACFENIPSAPEECWDLLSFRHGGYSTLLGVSSENIFSIDNQMKIMEVMQCKPWCLHQSKQDSARVYIGLEDGIASLYWDGTQWLQEAVIPEIKESVHSIDEDENGDLWLGHITGAIRIRFGQKEKGPRKFLTTGLYSIAKFDTASGLPELETVEIENVNGRILFGCTDGCYIFSGNRFVRQENFAPEFHGHTRQIHRLSYEKSSEKIWLETYLTDKLRFEFGYLQKEKDNSYSWNITAFNPYSEEVIHAIYHDEDGITWFGGSEGLYRYDSGLDVKKNNPYHAIIRKVTIGMDSAIFNGAYFDSLNVASLDQNSSLKAVLPFASNSIMFEYSSLDFLDEKTVKYSCFLEGFDKGWSSWKNETKTVYTNLPEGQYVFRIKSRNIANQESGEATYEFAILSPWYRTWWAYLLYTLGSAGFVWGVVTYTSRGLKAIIRERTIEIVKQKEVIEYKNRNITDSINYAKRIQEAILPAKDLMRSRFPESFILYRPKDIVAGDFYWFAEKEGKFVVAACDCTGHGVPGAFMSLISYSLLNEVLLEKHFDNPASALDTMKKGIIKSLGQTGQEGEQKDGMDMSLITLEVKLQGNKPANILSFAGANNPIYLIRKGGLIELTADKMPIGIYLGMEKPFTNKEMILEPGDTIYLFSDGYADQFGGKQGKKFTKKRYKELLLSIQHESMSRQKDILERTMDEWLGEQQQIDDVLVMGIRIS